MTIAEKTSKKHSDPVEVDVDQADVDWRKTFLQFDDGDLQRLREMQPDARGYADELIDSFYKHIMSFEKTRAFFRDAKLLERVKREHKEYFLQLMRGEYGSEYVQSRLKIGVVHQRIALPLEAYFGAYYFYLRFVATKLFGASATNVDKFLSLLMIVFFDISLALQSHVVLREHTIREQQERIRELSTPVLQVRDRLLIAPIIGMIDTQRARQLSEQLLHSIRSSRAKVVVMDITGVAVVDSAVANNLIQMVQASRLMGATVIVTGISSEIAQTLVRIGVDLSKLNTLGDLQEGIAEAERLLGYAVKRVADVATTDELALDAEEP
jgi:rsbT co-antagonist protein RsbR